MDDEALDKAPKKPQAPPARPKRIIVDELRDQAVTIGYSTVIFRPGQVLDSPHLIATAKQYGIQLREV